MQTNSELTLTFENQISNLEFENEQLKLTNLSLKKSYEQIKEHH